MFIIIVLRRVAFFIDATPVTRFHLPCRSVPPRPPSSYTSGRYFHFLYFNQENYCHQLFCPVENLKDISFEDMVKMKTPLEILSHLKRIWRHLATINDCLCDLFDTLIYFANLLISMGDINHKSALLTRKINVFYYKYLR